MKQKLMTVKQVAHYLGFKPIKIYKMVQTKRIPYIKVGKRVMFDVKDVNTWIEKLKEDLKNERISENN